VRFILGLLLVVLLLAVGWKVTGHQLPVVDYQLGPIGAPMVQPKIEVKPPGYDLNVP
jgi:hypothetical protein